MILNRLTTSSREERALLYILLYVYLYSLVGSDDKTFQWRAKRFHQQMLIFVSRFISSGSRHSHTHTHNLQHVAVHCRLINRESLDDIEVDNLRIKT